MNPQVKNHALSFEALHLVFAVLAGWRRIPSPSATASGSPNRLLCPNPVRYMSVINGPAELTIELWAACTVGSNV
jgi:hypothetical protein